MKKTFLLFVALVWALSSWAGYGILVNDRVYYAASYKGADEYGEGFQEYLAHVPISRGDYFQLCDPINEAVWAVALNTYSVAGFTYEPTNKRYTSSVSGCYDFYIKIKWEQDQLYIGNGSGCGQGEEYATMYKHSLPMHNTDVMMQAFFNESYKDDAPGVSETKDYKLGLGNTRWETLIPQAEEIGRYFDLVWLPPSANGDGMGYHPKKYSDQNSNWGSRAQLEELISKLHKAGAKVVADIVINHCAGWSTWCDFPSLDFGEYGTFYPDASYICRDDEVNKNSAAGACYGKATGSYDDGENWDGARDWSHDNVYVQKMFIAYLKWMLNVMHYDGFRYDKGDGFNNWHHLNYNRNAQPYIAFMECYKGTGDIQDRINGAEGNLGALDFDLKWNIFNDFAGWKYGNHRNGGDCLLGRGDYRHAVTFIDSHDWFLRDDNENEFAGRGNSLTPALKARLLQANAFMLSMPGVPCVFYPHWKKYKELIKPMIEARKHAGVHSQSEVKDVYVDNNDAGYQATIVGNDGFLILCLGTRANKQGFGANYKLMASYYSTYDGHNESYEIWVHRTTPIPTGNESIQPSAVSSQKILRDGQLYIKRDGTLYDVLGRVVR